MFKTVSEREKETLRFWQERDIFGKSLSKKSPKGDFVFYDGPPFATGTPHYGHFPSSFLKDVMPRYKTMRGYHVARRWGWDCHGLPIENIIEKELGFKTKKEIVEYGVAKFNEACRSTVLRYVDEWNKMIPRLGRWADMEHPYQTMDLSYMESVWWVFKQLWDKGLIYEGYKSMHVCPRCETTLSQQEVSEGYKDVSDWSAVAKFELIDEPGTFVLAWTTTPWTLPGNVALAVGKDIEYRAVRLNDGKEIYIAAEEAIRNNVQFQVGEAPSFTNVKTGIKGSDLVGKKYKPLFCYYLKKDLENKERLYTIIAEDFVTTDEGTGVVHIAPAFGEDDMAAGQKNKLPFIQHVDPSGHFKDEVEDFKGLNVKPIDDVSSTDKKIISNLEANNLLFSKEKFTHSYPHCWRCDTPLINYATGSWFVAVTKIKPRALKLAEKINWSPEHIKTGRFGKWLEGARDWSISRQRFWASVMPVWRCECGDLQVFGSVDDLEKASGKKITDLHKHIIDEITVPCVKCGKQSRRIPDVLDTWFDSGSMPYAQLHYPFENEKGLKKNFPAQFIAEGADQTRAWFYYLHILGTALFDKPTFENVIVNGIVLAEDGKKMSKRLKNYPDPGEVLEKYGADALRYYILTSPVVEADTLNFSESGVKESLQKTVMLILNVLSFYLMYQDKKSEILNPKSENVLDRWILAKLQQLNSEVTENLEAYDMVRAARPITSFINELSTWYLRRSRDRFKEGDMGGINTLGYVLREFSKLIAPFMPFVAEEIYRNVGAEKESVHLEDWPKIEKKLVNEKIISEMETVLAIVEKGLAARAEAGIKVRQPLARYTTSLTKKLDTGLIGLVTDELNVKELTFDSNDVLDTTISDELHVEGVSRELVRQINQMRKDRGLTIKDRITIYYQGFDEVFEKFGDELKKQTLADSITPDTTDNMKTIDGGSIGIKKVNS